MKNSDRNTWGIVIVLYLSLASCGTEPLKRRWQANAFKMHINKLLDSAKFHERTGNLISALTYHKRVVDQSRIHGLHEQEARSLISVAQLLMDDYSDSSLLYLGQAMHIADSMGHRQLKADIYYGIAETHRQQNNFKEALLALEAHHKLIDTLLTERRITEVANLKKEEQNKQERLLGLTITAAVFLILILLLIYTKKMRRLNQHLKRAIQDREKLLSMVSHDLRGPAGSLAQAIQLLGTGTITEVEEKKLLERLKNQSQSFSDTLDTLLQWANVQLRSTKTKPELFSPGPRIENMIVLLSGQSQSKSITIKSNVTSELSIWADANHFDLIIRNLVSNAIKFSFAGGTILLDAEKKGREVVFSICDEGVGMPPEKLKDLTDGQLESTYGTYGEKGTGLGLSLVTEFISANNGRIWAESAIKQGTSFYVALPARQMV